MLRLALALLAIAVLTPSAQADSMAHMLVESFCNHKDDPERQIRECTALIATLEQSTSSLLAFSKSELQTAYLRRAAALARTRQTDKAIADFGLAIGSPGFPALNDLSPDLADLHDAIAPPRSALDHILKGEVEVQMKLYKPAVQNLTRATDLGLPKELAIKVFHLRGSAYYLDDQPSLAFADFSKVIELDPNDSEAYQFLGIIRLDEGKYQEALANFDRAIAINPRDAVGYHYRCLDYEVLRSFEKAIGDCSRAIELGFALKLAETYHARGTSYAQLRQFDHARADLDKAIEINPRYASAYLNRCIVKQKLGLQNAIADCKKAVEIEPDNQHTQEVLMRLQKPE